MARYGSGYYHNLDSLLVGVRKGLREALYPTAEQMTDGIKDIIKQRLYDAYTPLIYERLGENGGVLSSVDYNINSTTNEIEFFFDDSKVIVQPQDSGYVAHKYLMDGYSTEDMISKWSRDNFHDDIEFEIKRYIRDEFPKIYRANCIALGLSLA